MGKATRKQIKVATTARAVRTAQAGARAADLAAIAGVTSLRAIARALNERGVPTATGVGEWRAVQVWRLLARL
jgi:hypothetical protein